MVIVATIQYLPTANMFAGSYLFNGERFAFSEDSLVKVAEKVLRSLPGVGENCFRFELTGIPFKMVLDFLKVGCVASRESKDYCVTRIIKDVDVMCLPEMAREWLEISGSDLSSNFRAIKIDNLGNSTTYTPDWDDLYAVDWIVNFYEQQLKRLIWLW